MGFVLGDLSCPVRPTVFSLACLRGFSFGHMQREIRIVPSAAPAPTNLRSHPNHALLWSAPDMPSAQSSLFCAETISNWLRIRAVDSSIN